MKRTFQPKNRQEKKEHGFMKRMETRAGRKVLKARRQMRKKKIQKKIHPEMNWKMLDS